jgi:hypothetical protein
LGHSTGGVACASTEVYGRVSPTKEIEDDIE